MTVSLIAISAAAFHLSRWVAGPNVSDVGVPMYAHGTAALFAGVLFYSLAVALLFGAVKKKIKNIPGLAWRTAVALSVLMLFLNMLLMWLCF